MAKKTLFRARIIAELAPVAWTHQLEHHTHTQHRNPWIAFLIFIMASIRDFKQRQRGRRREHHEIREKPKGPLRMTGGKQVDVLRLGPTWVKHISRCLKTWVFAFVSSAVSTLNKPVLLISRNFNACPLLLCDIFHFKETLRNLNSTQAGRRTCEYCEISFWKLM